MNDGKDKKMSRTCELVRITPEIAEEYLSHNVRNIRTMIPSAVKRYATSMLNGTYEENADTIGFYENGDLFNGQNRLKAIIESGKPQEIFVVRGIANDVTVTDTGVQRTVKVLSDSMGGNCSTNMLSAASIMYSGIKNISKSITPRESIAKYAIEHEDDFRLATNLSDSGRPSILRKGYAIALFYCYIRLSNNSAETISKIESFARAVNTGFYHDVLETSAIVLRNYLLANKNMAKSSYYVHHMSRIDMAFNDFQKRPRKRPYTPNDNIAGLVDTVRALDGIIK